MVNVDDFTQKVPKDTLVCDNPNCRKPNAHLRCSRCKGVYYCSRACATEHWKSGDKNLSSSISSGSNSSSGADGGAHKQECVPVLAEQYQKAGLCVGCATGRCANSRNSVVTHRESSCGICGATASVIINPISMGKICKHTFCFVCLQRFEQYAHPRTVGLCPICGQDVIARETAAENSSSSLKNTPLTADGKSSPVVACRVAFHMARGARQVQTEQEKKEKEDLLKELARLKAENGCTNNGSTRDDDDDDDDVMDDNKEETDKSVLQRPLEGCNKFYKKALKDLANIQQDYDQLSDDYKALLWRLRSEIASVAGNYRTARANRRKQYHVLLKAWDRKKRFNELRVQREELMEKMNNKCDKGENKCKNKGVNNNSNTRSGKNKSLGKHDDSNDDGESNEELMTQLNQVSCEIAALSPMGSNSTSNDSIRLSDVWSARLALAHLDTTFGRYKSGLELYQTVLRDASQSASWSMEPDIYAESQIAMCKILYHRGNYGAAIFVGEALLRHAHDRKWAGAHWYVALSYHAQGQSEHARNVASQAVLYETPWDDGNVQRNYVLWEALHELREKDGSGEI